MFFRLCIVCFNFKYIFLVLILTETYQKKPQKRRKNPTKMPQILIIVKFLRHFYGVSMASLW